MFLRIIGSMIMLASLPQQSVLIATVIGKFRRNRYFVRMEARVLHWSRMSAAERERLLRRSETDIAGLTETVAPIISDVRERGDAAVREHTARLDGADLGDRPLALPAEERASAIESLDGAVREAIDVAVENVTVVHREQLAQSPRRVTVRAGVEAIERVHPLGSVGLYVPHGRGSFPSMLYMLGVPAMLAGVPKIVVTMPPNPDGSVDAGCLYAAERCGVSEVFRIGGAQAIAALAFGTQSVPRVAKIVGPGSAYVSAAKRALRDVVDTGLPAGPSESMILADESAAGDPRVAWDLLIEAEHGADSAALLVTTSEKLAREVADSLPSLIEQTPQPRRGFLEEGFDRFGAIIVMPDLATGVELVNAYAPEHLQIRTASPEATLREIDTAAEVLLGPHSAFSVANYAAGTNAVLPTGGTARVWSGVSVHDFTRRSSVVKVDREGLEALRPHVVALAKHEGFYWHARALELRE